MLLPLVEDPTAELPTAEDTTALRSEAPAVEEDTGSSLTAFPMAAAGR